MTPDLTTYDVILINTSAGKDSQAMMDFVFHQAKAANITDRLIAVHCDLGRVEWEGTKELAQKQSEQYGIRFEVVAREGDDLLAHIEKRGKWPSSQARYCTSDFKRAPVRKLLTALVKEKGWAKGGRKIRVLNCMGLRAQESCARAKREPFGMDEGASNITKRHVDVWLPIHHWTEDEVWASIKASGVPYHPAYDLGMARLSCAFCIFAPKHQLLLAGRHNRPLLNDYVAAEKRMNHTFRVDQSLEDIQKTLDAEKPELQQGKETKNEKPN